METEGKHLFKNLVKILDCLDQGHKGFKLLVSSRFYKFNQHLLGMDLHYIAYNYKENILSTASEPLNYKYIHKIK